MLNWFSMKATFKSDAHQCVRWQRRRGNHLRGHSREPRSQMLWGLSMLLEKGKAFLANREPPERKLPWADQREPPSLTNRFSSRILGVCAPRRTALRDAGDQYGAGRDLEASAHEKGRCGGQPSRPHSDTVWAGGRMVWNIRMGDTGGISPGKAQTGKMLWFV